MTTCQSKCYVWTYFLEFRTFKILGFIHIMIGIQQDNTIAFLGHE